MQIIVLGAGAIGSLLGAKLAEANEVTLIGRPEHVRAIQAEGLRVTGREERVVRVRAATAVERVEPDTCILLTTKVPANRAVLAPLAPLLRADTTVIALQNGLASEEEARAVLPAEVVVLRGLTQLGAIFEAPGSVRYMVAGETLLQAHPRSESVAVLFRAAGLPCRTVPDIRRDVWRKLIFNCVVNPITALLGAEVGTIADEGLDPLKRLVLAECLAVAAAEGVHFEEDFLGELNALYAPSRNVVSMLQDLRRGRSTEIEHLNGAVVSLGKKHRLACPVNTALAAIVRELERAAAPTLPRESAPAADD